MTHYCAIPIFRLPRLHQLARGRQLHIRCLSSASDSKGQVLFLSPVWPERSSSAAGVRTADLIDGFREWGFGVAYSSPANPNNHTQLLEDQGVRTFQVAPNREQEMAEVLGAVQPTVCVFDRFYAEEAFSFRVRELAPKALRVLDMQDVHFLRAGRQELAAAGAALHQILHLRPTAASPECLRELAAIHRSDLTLVCSPEELRMLVDHYGVPERKLALAPFFTPPSPYAPSAVKKRPQQQAAAATGPSSSSGSGGASLECPAFGSRHHFMMIGNFRHPPNMDSVEWACREVWPLLREQLVARQQGGRGGPPPELHIYGSYAPGGAQRLHKPKQGVHLKGFAPSLDIMLQYRVALAPLRFGAGLKGKVVDSWWHGLPVCTTPIGAEGMHSQQQPTMAAEHHPGRGRSSGVEAGAATAAAGPAQEGYVWQMGGMHPSSSSASTSGVDEAGAVGGALDPAEEGYVWQMGGQSTSSGGSGRPGGSPQAPPDPAEEGEPWQTGPATTEPQQGRQQQDPSSSSGSGSPQQERSRGSGWGGLCGAETAEQLAADAARLYLDERLWGECQLRGFQLLEELYSRERTLETVKGAVLGALGELEQRRSTDFTGQLLWQQQFRATEFMSRWIELKEAARSSRP